MSNKKVILYISPHLDDAIISSACQIYKQVNEGFRVIIVTVFTDPGIEVSQEVKTHYFQRRSEDCDSAKLLGAEVIHLSFIDAPYRDKIYSNFNTILFHDQLPKKEIDYTDEIADRLFSLFDHLDPIEIYFPLGIGGHIDHHIVFMCSRIPSMKKFKIYYYEDMPYAIISEWISIRWYNLKAKPLNFLTTQFTQKRLTDYQLPFIDNYCSSSEDKVTSCKKFEKEWENIESMVNATLWMLNELEIFEKKCFEFYPELFKIKCKAVLKYSTEWPILFGSNKKDISKILSMHSCNEYYWSKI